MIAVIAGVTSFLVGLLCGVVAGVAVTACICWRKKRKGTPPSQRQSALNSPLYDYVDGPALHTGLELEDNVAYGHTNIN